MCDIALQLRRPTGHAVNPVPLTEAERIPSAAEIVEVHLLAREIEREVRTSPDLLRLGAPRAARIDDRAYAIEFRDRASPSLDDDGVDVGDAAQVLLALRRTSMAELERRVDLARPGRGRRARTVEGVARAPPRRTTQRRCPATRRRAGRARGARGARPGSRCAGPRAADGRRRGDPARRRTLRSTASCAPRSRRTPTRSCSVSTTATPWHSASALADRRATRALGRDDLHGRHPQPGHRATACRSMPDRRSPRSACVASTTSTTSSGCSLGAEHRDRRCYVPRSCDSGQCSSPATSGTIRRSSKTWPSRWKAPGSTPC